MLFLSSAPIISGLCLFVCLFACLFVCLFVRLSVCLFVCLFVLFCLFVCLFVFVLFFWFFVCFLFCFVFLLFVFCFVFCFLFFFLMWMPLKVTTALKKNELGTWKGWGREGHSLTISDKTDWPHWPNFFFPTGSHWPLLVYSKKWHCLSPLITIIHFL